MALANDRLLLSGFHLPESMRFTDRCGNPAVNGLAETVPKQRQSKLFIDGNMFSGFCSAIVERQFGQQVYRDMGLYSPFLGMLAET